MRSRDAGGLITAALLFLAPAVFVWADAYGVVLRAQTVYSIGAWFVVVSGVNYAKLMRFAGPIAKGISTVQRALEERAPEGDE